MAAEESRPTANYCPYCGEAVDAAQVFAVESEFIEQGVLGDTGAHVALEGGQLTIYSHAAEEA